MCLMCSFSCVYLLPCLDDDDLPVKKFVRSWLSCIHKGFLSFKMLADWSAMRVASASETGAELSWDWAKFLPPKYVHFVSNTCIK